MKSKRLDFLRYPNLKKIPTFFQRDLQRTILLRKSWDFFLTLSMAYATERGDKDSRIEGHSENTC